MRVCLFQRTTQLIFSSVNPTRARFDKEAKVKSAPGQVMQTTTAYPSLCDISDNECLWTTPPWDTSLSKGYHSVLSSPRTHLYTWVERGIVRVKCLAQENNAQTLSVDLNSDFLICSPVCLTLDYCIPPPTEEYSSITAAQVLQPWGIFVQPNPKS